MSKRKKITLTLAALLVAIGTGAQIYTNHKVDQVLQKFPYSLDNQATLEITESNKNFFSRDLTFSIKENNAESTAVVSTSLTTLPFFITAESKLSEQLVRQLNKTLNLTIDRNTINSKFSPVGDYLQSDVLVEFRDFANKPQQMSMSLNFLNNKEIELKTNLSGFHYDIDSKLEKVNGKARLIPVSQSQYDLANMELTAENAELVLLNGENTRLQLKNATYNFNTKKNEQTLKRDLNTKFSSDILRISNKERTTEESQTTFGGLNLAISQQGVPSAVNFYNEFKKITTNQKLKETVNTLVYAITQNDMFDAQLSVLSVNAPKNQKPYFNLQKGAVELKLNNQDLTDAIAKLSINVESVQQQQEDETVKWIAKGGKLSGQFKGNLQNNLAFIPFFLDSLSVKEPAQKDNKELLILKEKWAKEFHSNGKLDVSLQNFNSASLVIDNAQFNMQTETLENDQFNEYFALNAQKVALPLDGMQFEAISASLPFKQNHYRTYIQSAFCMDVFFPLCDAYLTEETRNKYDENQLKDLDLIVDNATVTTSLNTYPETKAYPIKLEANGIVSKAPEGEEQTAMNELFFNNIEGTFSLALNKMLIDDTDEKANEIKSQSAFWQLLKESVKPQEQLSLTFAEENDDYVLKLEKNSNGYFINGKSPEDLQQELEMEDEDKD